MKKMFFSQVISFILLTVMVIGSSIPMMKVNAEAIGGSIDADDNATLIPPDDYSYVDFAAQIDEEAEFTDDSVLVFMKRGETEVNKVYTAEDFPELDVAYVEDLTYLTNEDLLNDPEFMANYTQILQVHLNTNTEAEVVDAVEAMNDRSTVDVASVMPNYVLEAENHLAPTTEPHYQLSQSEYYNRINMPAAWSLVNEYTTQTVKVAILDTGITPHEDLTDNLINGYDAFHDIDSDFGEDSVDIIYSLETNDTPDIIFNPEQKNKKDHATGVAGIIGAKVNNIGVTGVALNVKIVPIQFYGTRDKDGNFSIDQAVFTRAISYLNNENIPIVNYSNSFPYTDSAIISAYETIINNYFGLFIASAGNDAEEIDETVGNLAKYDCNNIISVMGTREEDGNEIKCSYTNDDDELEGSNYSFKYVDIAAPWDSFSTIYYWDYPRYTYYGFSGTSASAPYVSGVAALIKSVCPKISTNDLKTAILEGADQRNSLSSCCIGGRFLDAKGALDYAIDNYEFSSAKTFMEDINGDGCDDLVYYREYGGQRHFQTFFGSNAYFLGQPYADDDTMTSYNTFKDKFNKNDLAYLGDVDGDGRKDMIIHSTNGSGKRVLTVYKGNSNKRFDSGVVTTTTNTHNTTTYPCAMFVGDFNGDNRDDFLVHYRDTNGKRTNLLYPGLSQASASTGYFGTPIRTYSTRTYVDPETDPIFVGNVDGIYGDDLIIHWSANNKRQLLVYPGSADGKFGSSDGTNAAPVNTNTNDNSDTSVYPCSLHVGDFNGDEKTDFLVHYKTLSGKRANYVFCGQAGATFASGIGTTFTETYDGTVPVFVGDITGDDKDDVIVQWVSGGTRRLITYRAALGGNATFGTGVHVNTNQPHTDDMSVRMYVGDVNGNGYKDFITEYASADTAYRSIANINLGISTGLQGYTYTCKLRTYFYIEYTIN